MKLSIIIPVYNVEKYLRKCVESLIKQDYNSYELILVDDGSTDNSPQICDEYVRAFEIGDLKLEIKCIHQANAGLSAARNAGLRVAKGEYVCFVDSDDYWEENVLGGLMEQVERENLDVLRFNYQNVRIVNSEELIVNSVDGAKYEAFQPNKNPHIVDKRQDVVDGTTYLNERMGYECYAVMFIIRHSLLIDDRWIDDRLTSIEDRRLKNEECLFTEGIHFEDVEWLPRMMLRAKRVASTNTIVYNYLIRGGSITQVQGNKEKIKKNIDDRLLIIDKYRQYLEQYPNCKWLRNMQSSMVSGVLTTIAREFYDERKEYIKRLNEMNVFPLSIADQGKTYRRRAVLTNLLGADLYCRLMHTMHRL